jgi:hypothetical protein
MVVVALLLSCERIGLEDYHIARNKKRKMELDLPHYSLILMCIEKFHFNETYCGINAECQNCEVSRDPGIQHVKRHLIGSQNQSDG